MRLLDRYLLRELFTPLTACLAGFLIFWLAFDLLGMLDDFQLWRLTWRDVVEYYWVRLPELLMTVLPVGFLLALLYALTSHARHHELTAMRAAGLGLWRICLPYLGIGFVFSAALFLINDGLATDPAGQLERIKRRRFPAAIAVARERPQLNFVNQSARRSWSIDEFTSEPLRLRGVTIEQQYADGSWSRLKAPEAFWTNGHWLLVTAEQFRYRSATDDDPARTRNAEYVATELAETPDQLRVEWRMAQLSFGRVIRRPQIPLRDIVEFRRLHPALQPREKTFLDTQLHARLAAPWTCLVVVFIAVPFGAPSGRRNIFFGVAGSIAIAFSYFVVQRVGFALGQNGTLPGWLAAWLPNIGFALAGFVLTQRVR